MNITFSKSEMPKTGALALLVTSGEPGSPSLKKLEKQSRGAITRAMKASKFTGAKGQILQIVSPAGSKLSRLVLFGVGKGSNLKALEIEKVGGQIASKLSKSGEKSVTVLVDVLEGADIGEAVIAAHVGYGALLKSYRFDKYKTKVKPAQKPSLTKIVVATGNVTAARRLFAPLKQTSGGIFFTRDLVSEPANVLHPSEFAERVKELKDLGVKVEILNEKKMADLGMGALLGVGQGSAQESKMAIMEWRGSADTKSKPVAFIGKGVTFDTGGISIKPAAGMEMMKWDMGGAGAVSGLMQALAARKAKVNAVGVIGLVENMPSSTAQRPGDVVTSMSGQTIEVINTDAEGRLVLADALWYTQDRFKPKMMIDLATLTGAILVSLANEYAGLFTPNDDLAEKLIASGEAEGEKLWRMPLGDAFDKMINSQIADMKNVGGRYGGSTTAAQFLQRFVNKVPWAHLDIAGMAWADSDLATVPKGGSGYGVRLLNRLVADYYED